MKRIVIGLAAVAVGAAVMTGVSTDVPEKVTSAFGDDSTRLSAVAAEKTLKPGLPSDDPDAPSVPKPYYELVVAISNDPNDPKLERERRLLNDFGYEAKVEQISPAACKHGNKYQYFDLNRDQEYYIVALIFSTKQKADQLADVYQTRGANVVENNNCTTYDSTPPYGDGKALG